MNKKDDNRLSMFNVGNRNLEYQLYLPIAMSRKIESILRSTGNLVKEIQNMIF